VVFYKKKADQREAAAVQFNNLIYGGDMTQSEDQQNEALAQLSKQASNPRIAAEAGLKLAQRYAYEALVAKTPKQRKDLSDKARQFYRPIAGNAQFPVMAANARLGLGSLAENAGDYKTARQEYQSVAKASNLNGQPVKLLAQTCLTNLDVYEKQEVRMAVAPTPTSLPAGPTLDSTQPAAPATSAAAPAKTAKPAASRINPKTNGAAVGTHATPPVTTAPAGPAGK